MNDLTNAFDRCIAIIMSALLTVMIFPFVAFAEDALPEATATEISDSDALESDQDGELTPQDDSTLQSSKSEVTVDSDGGNSSDIPSEPQSRDDSQVLSTSGKDDASNNHASSKGMNRSSSSLNDSSEDDLDSDGARKGNFNKDNPKETAPNSAASEVLASGVSGTCEWLLHKDGVLVLSASEDSDSGQLTFTYSDGRAVAPWDSYKADIVSVSCDASVIFQASSLSGLFSGYGKLKTVDFENIDLSSVSDFSNFFTNCFDLENVRFNQEHSIHAINLNRMFFNCSKLKNLDISDIDASATKNMASMFEGCSNITTIDLSDFENKDALYTEKMFYGCDSLLNIIFSDCFAFNSNMALREGIWESNGALCSAFCLGHFAKTDLEGVWTYKGNNELTLAKDDGVYRLKDSQGEYLLNTWYIKDLDHAYYFDEDGKSVKHLVTIDGARYYFDGSNFTQVTDLLRWKDGCSVSYFDPDNGGRMATCMWVSDVWYNYYIGPDGYSVKHRQKIGDDIYYFNAAGQQQFGWIKWEKDGRYSFFSKEKGGAAAIGWTTLPKRYYDDSRYYFDDEGYALRYRQLIDGDRYYFNGEYEQHMGVLTWKKDGRISFYDPKQGGKMSMDRWISWKGKRYYLDEDGYSVRYRQNIKGRDYYFNGAGQQHQGVLTWKKDGRISFCDPKCNGEISKNRWISWKGKKYYLDENGYSVRYRQTIKGNKYYFNKACQMQTGVVIWKATGKLSYFDPKQGGKASTNRWISYKGTKYYLDENGYSTKKVR